VLSGRNLRVFHKETCCLLPPFRAAACSSETSVSFYQTTRRKRAAEAKRKSRLFYRICDAKFHVSRYLNKYLSRLFAYSLTGGMYSALTVK
jgi:hypothetical protein